jgi:hypothetical protein
MNILASEKQKRSTASNPVNKSIARPGAVSSIKSRVRTFSAAFCMSVLAVGPVPAKAGGSDAQSAEAQNVSSTVALSSGTYHGVWRDEDGKSGETRAIFDVNGDSIKGKLTLAGVKDYSGDRINGKVAANDDGTLSVEFKTRDGKWKSKAVFDGQLLVGTYFYTFQDRRVQKIVKGEWAAQQVPD